MGCGISTLALAPRTSSTEVEKVPTPVPPVQPKMPKTTVVVPLYIYPLPGAWEALYDGITAHPHVSFIIIVNPHNGPGLDSNLPDASYRTEIARLNGFPNVTTVGYVRIDYCKRPLEVVREDIAKYGHWSTIDGLGMHGIFFDETPNLYSPHVAQYMTRMNAIVKAENGLVGDRLVIHNPGTIPDHDLAIELRKAQAQPDLTAVVEDSYANYVTAPFQERLMSLCRPPHFTRSNTCYILHSVPRASQAALARSLSYRAAYIFLTDRCSCFYEGFGQGWKEFLDVIGGGGGSTTITATSTVAGAGASPPDGSDSGGSGHSGGGGGGGGGGGVGIAADSSASPVSSTTG